MIDPAEFRRTLGHYPTGVCAITAVTPSGERAAMVVGTFTSVSLDPPLVGFFPDKRSKSWAMIHEAGRFCVNVLASDEKELCMTFSRPSDDKYAGVDYTLSANGSPVLTSAMAWIDCDIHDVIETGDHYLVLGLVREMKAVRQADPMLFFVGSYGGFADLENKLAG